MKKIFTMLLAVTLIMTCMVVAPVGAEAPDLTQDFVKTFVETTTSAQAADSLIKTQEGQENAYRLWNSNNIDGRNSTQVDTVGSGEAVTDFDDSSKSATLTVYPTGTEITVGNEVISGVKIPAVNTKREWLDKSGLKDGDTIVVSIYAKTAEAGTKTFFNMGLIENSKTFGYNALTAEYGTTGMEIDSNWKKFAGTITIPNGFEKDGMAGKSYYTLHFGYPVPCANPAKIHVSTVYAAKAAAVDMSLSLDKAEIKAGESATAKAQLLNQIGTVAGVSQNFTWYVTNGDRTQILTDSGITVTPGENGEATVTAGASVQSGSYAIVAVGENGEVKGLPLRIVACEPTPTVDLTKDFVKTYEETTSTQQAADSLIKTQEGQENAYRLWNSNNIDGRNSTQVVTTSEAVVDIDETSKWGTVTVYPTGTEIADGSEVISGASIPTVNTKRDWLDKSGLKDGDTIVVSIYAKTAKEGKKTFFNMGLIENSKTFGYNALTAEYGTTGMEIDSSWKKFAGTITIPNGFEKDGMVDQIYYTLHFGYPVPCANPAKIHVSTIYAAKVAVAEMENRFEDGETALEKGQSKKLLTKTLNQIGTTAGLSQDFTYYVTNQDRTEILTDSGITVTPGAAGEATVAAAETTADGTYYIVAVAPTGEVMGQQVTVTTTVSLTCAFGANGSVTVNEEAKQDGDVISLKSGDSVTVSAVPVEGYEIKEIKLGTVGYTPDSNGSVTINNITEDAVLTVTFQERTPVSPSVSGDQTYNYFKTVDGLPTAYVYGKLNDFYVPGGSSVQYGMKLWASGNEIDKLTLPAIDPKTQQPAVAKAGAIYAIRVYGPAITAEQTYVFQPYVGETEGTEMTVTFKEE